MFHPADFFDLAQHEPGPSVAELFAPYASVWEILAELPLHVTRLVGSGQTLLGRVMPGAYIGHSPIYLAADAVIEPGACVLGPAYIGPGVIIRHGAYVREHVILLAGSLLGHASEAKQSLFLPGAHAPHFNYVGDSVLGRRVNLGAGTKLSNVPMTSTKDSVSGRRSTIQIRVEAIIHDTGLSKFGAVLGDDCQTGCNAVLNPGCLLGPRSLVYPNASLRKGYYRPDSVLKLRQEMVTVERR